MKVDFNDLKSKISLPDFLRDNFGWTFEKGSSQSYPKMKSPDTGQVIVIKRNKQGFYTYFDVHDSTIRGKTILDFMQNQFEVDGKKLTLRDIGEILCRYMDEGKTILPEHSSMGTLISDTLEPEQVQALLMNLKPLQNFSFLENRGISNETLKSKVWDSVFFENVVFDTENKRTYKNTCVRLQNIDGVQGLSQRNHIFKGALGNRFNTVASSSFQKDKPIVKLLIGESMIDCVSHCQMNPTDENVLYLSSEGSLTEGQIETINILINKYNIDKFTTIFDKDRAGQSYSLRLLGTLLSDNYNYHFTVHTTHTKEKEITMIHYVGKGSETENMKIIQQLFPMDKLSNYISDEEYKISFLNKTIIEKQVICQYQIEFPYNLEILIELSENIGKVKFSDKYKLELPNLNDFNDDLKFNLGILDKEKELEDINYGREGKFMGFKAISDDRFD